MYIFLSIFVLFSNTDICQWSMKTLDFSEPIGSYLLILIINT